MSTRVVKKHSLTYGVVDSELVASIFAESKVCAGVDPRTRRWQKPGEIQGRRVDSSCCLLIVSLGHDIDRDLLGWEIRASTVALTEPSWTLRNK